jgi:hypothetical protein
MLFIETNMPKSDDHIYRCVDIIKADKSISDQTIIIMFLTYKNLIIEEYEKTKSPNVGKSKSRSN